MSHPQRLLAGVDGRGPITLARHTAVHGPLPDVGTRHAQTIIDSVAEAGLRGCGGGGFPMARKLAAVAGARGAIVVANGVEGEPMAHKDRVMLEYAPHLVLDGAELAARLVGAGEALIATPPDLVDSVERAIEERPLRRDAVALRAVAGGTGYVDGEETALLAHLEGRPGRPRVKPPLVAQHGLDGRPTLVQNVETLCHLALIARRGPGWFRQAGDRDHPGTRLVTLGGGVDAPGVYEVAADTRLSAVVALGRPGHAPRATLNGGYFGQWASADGGDALVTGAGVVVALGPQSCGVAETARVARWLADQSAGQCGPCVNGLDALAGLLERVHASRLEPQDRERLPRWLELVQGRGACRHPDGAARLITSAARVFSEEFNAHARGEPCAGCLAEPVLWTPRVAELVAA